MIKKRPLYLLFLTTISVALTSCLTPPMYDEIKADENKTLKEIEKQTPVNDHNYKVVKMKCGPYVDPTPISLRQPPAWLFQQVTIKGRMLPLDFYMKDILKGTNALILYQEPSTRNTLLSFDYKGNIKGALDYIAAQTDFAYEIQGRTISWSKFITKTIDISFMPGTTNYFLGQAPGSGGAQQPASGAAAGASSSTTTVVTGSSSVGTQYTNISGKLSVWDDLKNTIKNLLSPEGKATISESTTSVTIQDRPGSLRAIEKYLCRLNKELSRQVLVKIQILDFKSNRGFDYGVNWNLIMGSIAAQGAQANPVPLGVSVADQSAFSWILPAANTSQKSGGAITPTQIFISALNQQGVTTVVTQPTLVTLNNQVAEININTETGYLAEVVTTVTGTSGTAQTALTPGVVNNGFTIYVLPKIVKDKIYLQITSNLSNPPVFASQSSGGETIQVPTLDEQRFNQRSLIPNGATLVLAGYRQVSDQTGKDSYYGTGILGGVGGKQNKAETIMLVTPMILGNDDA